MFSLRPPPYNIIVGYEYAGQSGCKQE